VTLPNGIEMPMVAAGVYQYSDSEAEASITAALKAGFTMVDTALDYNNQKGVGRAVAASSLPREQVFVQTKVPGCGNPRENTTLDPYNCYNDTVKNLNSNLDDLGLEYVDSVIVHFPPAPSFYLRSCTEAASAYSPSACEMVREQWRAMTEFYIAGKARVIGVSNFCPSCFACLKDAEVQPLLNQIMYHIGSGADPSGIFAFHREHNITTQAYSVLGNTDAGHPSEDIMRGNVTSRIASAHNVSTAQVALKFVLDKGVAAVTKSSNPVHLQQDLDLWSWGFTAAEIAELDAHVSPDSPTYYSYACDAAVVV